MLVLRLFNFFFIRTACVSMSRKLQFHKKFIKIPRESGMKNEIENFTQICGE